MCTVTAGKDLEAEIHPLRARTGRCRRTQGPGGERGPRGRRPHQTRLSRCRTRGLALSCSPASSWCSWSPSSSRVRTGDGVAGGVEDRLQRGRCGRPGALGVEETGVPSGWWVGSGKERGPCGYFPDLKDIRRGTVK